MPLKVVLRSPKIFERRVRGGQSVPLAHCLMAKLVETRRIAHIQRVQQDRIDHSEDDDVHADPQHQT